MCEKCRETKLVINITMNKGCEDLVPKKAHDEDAGYDIKAACDTTLKPGIPTVVSTGCHIGLPKLYEAQIRPRSGMALKNNITVNNTPGTVDCGYRDTIGVILINHGTIDYDVKRGDRIAQMVINKLPDVELQVVDSLDDSERGLGGFGSTGK